MNTFIIMLGGDDLKKINQCVWYIFIECSSLRRERANYQIFSAWSTSTGRRRYQQLRVPWVSVLITWFVYLITWYKGRHRYFPQITYSSSPMGGRYWEGLFIVMYTFKIRFSFLDGLTNVMWNVQMYVITTLLSAYTLMIHVKYIFVDGCISFSLESR